MASYTIPKEWFIGIETIDQEHQELLNSLSKNHEGGAPSPEVCDGEFDEFLLRLSTLMENKLHHMDINKFHEMERVKLDNRKTLNQLVQIQKHDPSILLKACRLSLLGEISHSKTYYTMVGANSKN